MRFALVAVLVASTVHVARADEKYKRNQDVHVTVNLSDRVKPVEPKQQGTSEFKPELNADMVLNIEGLVGGIRAEQEQILADLIAQTPDTEVEEKSDYYFRLGELYAKQQRFYRLKAAEALIAVDKAKTPQQKAQLTAMANKAADTAKAYLLKAVKTYKGLTDNDAFRNYPKMDMALFYYGYTLQGGKYMKEARAVYDKLLKNYPSSKYVPEAHLAFADYYFENNQLDDAEERYKQVLKFPRSPAYWYAMYKMGWIHLNKQRFQEALETFYQVAQATKGDKKNEILNRASKKDFVRAYAEIGKADQAFNAFKRVDAGYALDMLQILADLYMEQGKSDRAIYTYRDLMKREPTNKNVCLWQYNVAHAMLSMPGANNADKVAEIENLNHLWGALKTKKVLPAAEQQECHDNAAAMSGELARAYHSESAKTKNPETLGYAEKLYRVYLEVFPDAEDFAQTQYFYAELLWSRAEAEKNQRLQSDMWEKAANEFTEVVKLGKVEPKLMKESAYAAVLGWKNALNVDPRPKQQAADDDPKEYEKKPEPLPIPEKEQKMLAAFDIYIKYIKDPKDDELVGMKFLKANTYRRYNHFDEAIPIFEDILFNHSQHETAEFAANLLLDTYNRLHKYDEMLALVDKLDGMPKFLEGKDDLKTTLATIKAQSMRKKAEKLEADAKDTKDFGKYVECGLAYQDIYNRNPEDPKNDEVLYNAGVCFEEGKSIGAAIQMFNTLEKYYPKSKTTQRAIARLGKAYADIAFYDRASEKYEQYAKAYAGEKDAFDVMSDAVFFRKGIGDDDKAIADTKYFIDTFSRKKPADAANAAYSLTSIYEKRGDNDGVVKHLHDYIRTWGAKGGADKLVIAHAKIGNILWHQSCPVKEIDGACVKVTRERAVASKTIKKKKGKETYVAPIQCGPESKIKLTVVKRDDRKVHEALGEFRAAEAEFEKMKGDAGDPGFGGARYWYAMGKFVEADVEYEKYLDIKFPANLNFGDGAPEHKAIKEKAQKRFNDWLAQKTKAADAANQKYAKVLEIKDNANSIAAAAREGQITENFSDELFTAEIPKDVRATQIIDGYDLAQDKVDAYCDALTTAAEPLAEKSLAAYGVCLSKSTDLGWFSDWSKLCEHELGQIKPEEFPTASELRGDPNEVAPVISAEPPPRIE
ncbi:MAG TPA: tetratricopeptide repeat protein [Kofleriaceae bacterium]|nr:tetratricopeptide repeat protein [Kofleriaceae bacterium]